jgi:hypothetical protein
MFGSTYRNGMRAVAMAIVLGLALPSAMMMATPAAAAPVYAFPALPLSEALTRLGEQSGFHVNYDERLAHGLTSHPVSAATAQEALDQMLLGTGLAPRFTRRDAFTLVRRSLDSRADMRLEDLVVTAPIIGKAKSSDYAWYGSMLLEECFRKLRGQTALKGRKYELQLYVWLDAAGTVTRIEAVGPEEQAETRMLIEEALTELRMVNLPPSAMPQPIKMRISAM